jgi:Family of unknown function (DUF5941)
MTTFAAYRDDGLLARWVGDALGRGEGIRPLTWLGPPLVRALEYGFLIVLTALAEPDAMPLCFAFLGVLAFHHYDIVYRLRHQGVAPPAWVQAAGGGWDGRMLAVSVLAVAGVLEIGLLVAAVALALVYVTESMVSWVRFVRDRRPTAPEEDEKDEDGE